MPCHLTAYTTTIISSDRDRHNIPAWTILYLFTFGLGTEQAIRDLYHGGRNVYIGDHS